MVGLTQHSKPLRHRQWFRVAWIATHSRSARVPRAILEPGIVRVYREIVGALNYGPRDEPGMTGQRLKVRAGHIFGGPNITRCGPFDLRGSCKCVKRSARTSPPKSEAARTRSLDSTRGIFCRRLTRGWRESSKPPGRRPGACGTAPWVATRDSFFSGSRLACCC